MINILIDKRKEMKEKNKNKINELTLIYIIWELKKRNK